MDIDLGPKNPDRLIRIRVDEQVLRFHSGSIHEATWEIARDDDASCLNLMSLRCISYYDSDHTLSSDYTFYALAKLPNQCKYLVLCENSVDCGVFVLQGGSNTSLKSSSGLFTSLAKDCYIIFKRSRDNVLETNGFFFTKNPISIGPRKGTVSGNTLQDILSMNSYDSGSAQNRVCMVAMEGLGQMDESYPSLEEPVGQMPGDFVTGITRNAFNTTILGGADFVCKPSQVPVRQAIDVLRWQEDRKWKLLSDAAIPAAEVQLESLHIDVDSGIFHLSAIPAVPGIGCFDTHELIESIKKVLPIEMKDKCSTSFVSRGKQWRFCLLSENKPTIFQKGIYVRLPQPDHTNESIKIWIHLPESKVLKGPDKFLDTIREVFDRVAKSIVESEPQAQSQREILLSILSRNSSSQIARIPGGITLPIVSFMLIARIHPEVQLVFETYNGKIKGLNATVNVRDGVPELSQASEKLVELCIRSDSLFSTISKLILNKTFSFVVSASSFGFGFRATYRKSNASKLLVLASLNSGLSENAKVQLFPLAYLDMDICPNVSSPSDKSTTYSNGVRRSQFYLECWSMHKASNITSMWSYSRVGQNLKAATSASQKDQCATLNTSVLRNGMLDTCQKFDQSFELSSKTGGSRFEIAVQPALVMQNDPFAFDFQKNIESCWLYIQSNVRFDDSQTIVKFGVLNTAACFIGYRAALDQLSVSTPGTQSQKELLCFVRYMNATLHSLCNGLYADGQNPKLFLSKYGLAAGRPLALIPTVPLLVWERIRLWDMSCPLPTVEAPFSVSVPADQPNRILLRIAENTGMTQIEDCMICWSCHELFFGNFDTRYTLLQDHLKQYNHWVDSTKKIEAVNGKMWRIDFENKRKAFEMKLQSVEGNDDQRWAYKLAMTWTNLCLVGVPGSGKTWVIKNLGLLLESIFFKPGEIIFCSPLGRVAMNLHPDARTIHRVIKIKPGYDRNFPESLEQLATHLSNIKPRPFVGLKLIVGTEMFMCTTPHLQSLLQFVHKSLENMDAKVLFDGDPIQLSTCCRNSAGHITSGTPFLITPYLNTACPGILHVVFEDTMHFRIQNAEKLRHLKLMRSRQADDSTLTFFEGTFIDTSKPFLTLFATVAAASNFNDKKFFEHFRLNPSAVEISLLSEDTHVQSKKRIRLEESDVRDLLVETVIKVASGVPIIVVQNCWGIPMGQDDRKSTLVFVGNGAAGTFVKLDGDIIVVNLTMAGKKGLFILSRVEFPVETQSGNICVRRQFPIMLAWATNIHKVQGMQFDQLQVDFELGMRDGSNEFYEGMAYMALSRANVVQIIGDIHLKLLNNVNIKNLQWWEKELENWKAFKRGNVSKVIFRNNIHESNHRFAALHSRYLIVARDAHLSCQSCDINIDDASDSAFGSPSATVSSASTSATVFLDIDSAPTPPALATASAPHILLESALMPAPPPQKKRRTNASDLAHSKQPGLPLAPAAAAAPVPAQKRQNTTVPASLSSNTSHDVRLQKANLPAVAAAQATAPAPALVTAPGLALDTDKVVNPAPKAGAMSRAASLSVIESDEEFELIVMPPASTSSATPAVRTAVAISVNPDQVGLLTASLPAFSSATVTATTVPASAPRNTSVLRVVFEVDWTSVGRDDIGPAKLPGVKNDWLRMKLEDKVKRIEGLWNESTTELGSYNSNWDKGLKLFTSDGFGEVTASFCLFMVEIHAKHTVVPIHQQTFIDIGSGLAKAVCQVATLQPNFSSCFGIELQADRCCHSTEITSSFAKEALRALVPFCRISLVQGDCLQNPILRHKLSRAGLIFINNEIFSIKMNQVKMTFALIPQTSNSHRTSSRF